MPVTLPSWLRALEALMVISNTANTFVMYLRVKAVFAHSPPAVSLFTLTCAACTVGYVVSAFALHHTSLLDLSSTAQSSLSDPCAFALPQGRSLLAGVAVATANDTSIFLAITYRILSGPFFSTSGRSLLNAFLKGEGLGAVSRLLLQTGQLYYL